MQLLTFTFLLEKVERWCVPDPDPDLSGHSGLKCSSTILQVSVACHLNSVNKLLKGFSCYSRGREKLNRKVFWKQLLSKPFILHASHIGAKGTQWQVLSCVLWSVLEIFMARKSFLICLTKSIRWLYINVSSVCLHQELPSHLPAKVSQIQLCIPANEVRTKAAPCGSKMKTGRPPCCQSATAAVFCYHGCSTACEPNAFWGCRLFFFFEISSHSLTHCQACDLMSLPLS